MYASIDLEEIQLCKNVFFILFYWGNLSNAKILSFYLYLPIIHPSFVAPTSEVLPMYFDKKPENPPSLILSVIPSNKGYKIIRHGVTKTN